MNALAADPDRGWLTRERLLTLTLVLFTLLALYICYLISVPFIPALSFALALAVATQRPYVWVRRHIHDDTWAAAAGTALVALLIIGPIAFLGTYLVQQALNNLNELQSGEAIGSWQAALERQPRLAEAYHWVEQRFDIQGQAGQIAQNLAGQATSFLRGSVNVVTQLVITLFVLFFLYRDNKKAMDAAYHLVPLSNREAKRLFDRISSTIQATVNGSITVAAVQATLAGIMYTILGVPGAVLWGALTFVVALVPVFGTFMVWGPIALYLAITGHLGKAAILVGWGVTAIGMIDNVLYPYLVGDKLRMHTVPTFFAILGGVSVFGPVGLILGPMALAITVALLDVWWQRTTQGHSAEEAVVENNNERTAPRQVLQEKGVS